LQCYEVGRPLEQFFNQFIQRSWEKYLSSYYA
jgi:hypothetical protein